MGFTMTTEEFFKRNGYRLNTSLEEALEIKAKQPSASDPEVAKMNILQKRNTFATSGNWGMYEVTVSNLAEAFSLIGDSEQELECYLQIFYLTMVHGRKYTQNLIYTIEDLAEKCSYDTDTIIQKYQSAIDILPNAITPVPAVSFLEQLTRELTADQEEEPPDCVPIHSISASDNIGEMDGYFLLSCIEKTAEAGAAPGFLISLYEAAEEKQVSQYTKFRICKILGELYEETGDVEKAITALKRALEYNPKAPVKRLIAKLEKKRQ